MHSHLTKIFEDEKLIGKIKKHLSYLFKLEELESSPFVGSVTICIAALKTNRKYVAYGIERKYCALAERRIKQFLQKRKILF